MIFDFSKEMYTKEALISAAYRFTDKAYVHLDVDDKNYIVNIKMKEDVNSVVDEEMFVNEILTQMVRQEIQRKTKNIREIIMARAFSSTMIYNEDVDNIECEKVDIADILVDWFDKYE